MIDCSFVDGKAMGHYFGGEASQLRGHLNRQKVSQRDWTVLATTGDSLEPT